MNRANPSFATLIPAFHDSSPRHAARLAGKDFIPESGGVARANAPASPGKCALGEGGRKEGRKRMSCFLMDENRIAALAHEIITKNTSDPLADEQGQPYDGERLADAMLAMNIDAFRQRYGIKTLLVEDLDCIDLDTRNRQPLEALSEVQMFKSLQCFLYQCAEGDVDERPLYKALSAIRELLAPFIHEDSPEYEAAQWG